MFHNFWSLWATNNILTIYCETGIVRIRVGLSNDILRFFSALYIILYFGILVWSVLDKDLPTTNRRRQNEQKTNRINKTYIKETNRKRTGSTKHTLKKNWRTKRTENEKITGKGGHLLWLKFERTSFYKNTLMKEIITKLTGKIKF